MKKGIFIVISGPSGVGKNTIADILVKRGYGIYSVSVTTRSKRPTEEEGKDYFFVSKREFEEKIDRGEFLEYAKYNDNYYGTLKSFVLGNMEKGTNVIAVVEIQGGMNIERIFPDAVLIFIVPPSMEILEERLRKRNTDSEEDIRWRMENSKREMKYKSRYDYVVINDDIEKAVFKIADIIEGEMKKRDA